MRIRIGILPLLFLVIWPSGAIGGSPPQQGYSTAPLKRALFDPLQVALRFTALNEWLNLNYAKLDQSTVKGPREALYYLIDSRIKEVFANTGEILPGEPDLLLQNMFNWAARLGVYGGALAFNAVRDPDLPKQSQAPALPSGFDLALRGDLFELRSENDWWSAQFPYYFMIDYLYDFIANNGKRTQMVAISTGAARHQNNAEWSQATLVLIFSPDSSLAELSDFLVEGFSIGKEGRSQLGIDDLSSYRGIDTQTQIYKEATFWMTRRGALAVVYLGVDGTYQWNRPHFLDFVRSLRSSG